MNTTVQADLKIDAKRESNSHSKYAVLNKCARIIADVILKALMEIRTEKEGTNPFTHPKLVRGITRCLYAR